MSTTVLEPDLGSLSPPDTGLRSSEMFAEEPVDPFLDLPEE